MFAQSLVVWQKSGGCVLYALNERPTTTFNDDYLIITTTKVRVEYPLENVARYTYDLSDKIDNTLSDKGLIIKQTNSEIVICNLPLRKTVSLYGVDGKLLSSAKSTGQVRTSLPIGHLATGTYLVKTDNITYKIQKR